MKAPRVSLFLGVAWLFAGGCSERVEPQEESSASTKTGFVTLGDAKLYYEELGEGYPLVMLHGGLLDRRMWDPQFEAFAQHYRVIRYDARNHGESEGVPGTFSHSDDLAQLLEQWGIEKAAFMGLSLGGRTLIDFAIAYPEKVSALVLVSPGMSGYALESDALNENNEQMREAFDEGDLPRAIEYFQRSWTDGPGRAPSDVDPAVRESVRIMAEATAESWNFESTVRELEPPAAGRLSEIRAPTLVVVGDLDMPGILEVAEAVDEKVEGAEVVVISGAAHMVNLEEPDAFNGIVLDYLEETLPR